MQPNLNDLLLAFGPDSKSYKYEILKTQALSRNNPAELSALSDKVSEGVSMTAYKTFWILLISLFGGPVWASESSEQETATKGGAEFEIVYKGELSSVLNGGLHRQTSYLENLDLRLNIDLQKLVGWQGASLFFYGLGNRGSTDTNSPTFNIGDIQGTSNIQTASSAFVLYEAWYQQVFAQEKASLLVGLHDLNSEFYNLDSAALFFNASFGGGQGSVADGGPWTVHLSGNFGGGAP